MMHDALQAQEALSQFPSTLVESTDEKRAICHAHHLRFVTRKPYQWRQWTICTNAPRVGSGSLSRAVDPVEKGSIPIASMGETLVR